MNITRKIDDEYEVRFRHANSYDWFTVYVLFRGEVIYEKSLLRSYPRAARLAKQQIACHRLAVTSLGELIK